MRNEKFYVAYVKTSSRSGDFTWAEIPKKKNKNLFIKMLFLLFISYLLVSKIFSFPEKLSLRLFLQTRVITLLVVQISWPEF
jgi:hypothetical protein